MSHQKCADQYPPTCANQMNYNLFLGRWDWTWVKSTNLLRLYRHSTQILYYNTRVYLGRYFGGYYESSAMGATKKYAGQYPPTCAELMYYNLFPGKSGIIFV